METIYLVRHATPDWTRTDLVYYLPPGPPLTEQGRMEAQALGEFLNQVEAGTIYSSPLERCLQTARIAASAGGITWQVVSELAEWRPGETEDEIRIRFGPVLREAAARAAENGPIVLVTHGGPIGVLLLELGMDLPTLLSHRIFDRRNPLPPAGAWKASRLQPGEPWNLELVFKPEEALTYI